MKIVILASGSSGNATLFEAHGTRVLVDAGIGPRALATRLGGLGVGMPDAIVITHEHSDHVGHAARIAKKGEIPIWASEATARCEALSKVAGVRVFSAREPFAIGAITISPLPLPHDAAQVALVLEGAGRRAAIVTDLGEVPPALPHHLARCDVALIESNHDPDMLRLGPYPAHLKRRIASARGHLSNQQASALLRALPIETHTVALMHLSRTNNRPDLALDAARDALRGRGVRLVAAPPNETVTIDAAAPPPAQKGAQMSLFRL